MMVLLTSNLPEDYTSQIPQLRNGYFHVSQSKPEVEFLSSDWSRNFEGLTLIGLFRQYQ